MLWRYMSATLIQAIWCAHLRRMDSDPIESTAEMAVMMTRLEAGMRNLTRLAEAQAGDSDGHTVAAVLKVYVDCFLSQTDAIPLTPNGTRGVYLLFFDGGSRGNPGPGGTGSITVRVHENSHKASLIWVASMAYSRKDTTNNFAEYWGLIHGLREAQRSHFEPFRRLADCIDIRGWYHHYRAFNKMADSAANLAMDTRTSTQVHFPTQRAAFNNLTQDLDNDVMHWLMRSSEDPRSLDNTRQPHIGPREHAILLLESQQGDAVVNPRIATIDEEQGARMQIKTLASNLPYIHRNPAKDPRCRRRFVHLLLFLSTDPLELIGHSVHSLALDSVLYHGAWRIFQDRGRKEAWAAAFKPMPLAALSERAVLDSGALNLAFPIGSELQLVREHSRCDRESRQTASALVESQSTAHEPPSGAHQLRASTGARRELDGDPCTAVTPLEKRWIKKNHLTPSSGDDDDEPNDLTKTTTRCQELMTQLRRKDERAQLKHALFEKLRDEVYRMECADTPSATALRGMLQRVLKHFPLADELRSLIRNAERLFPPPDFTRGIQVLENICNLYFDRIDPTTVEGMVKSIYAHIPDLQDIKFLVKHAAALFPKDACDVDGQEIHRKLVALQQEIAQERTTAIDKLLAAVKTLYGDTEPDQVLNLTTKVAALFKNTKELRSLTADVATVFPVEFLNANPHDIRAVFLRMKAEVLGTSTTASVNSKTTKAKTTLHATNTKA
ncbi:hypothetical protein FI667_g2696, partial [Globisporangium splendens]